MNLSSLYKQLKKRLRQKRRWLALGFFIVAAVAGLLAWQTSSGWKGFAESGKEAERSVAVMSAGAAPESPVAKEQRETLERIREAGVARDVYLHKTYVCGEEHGMLGRMEPNEVMSLHQEHPDWSVKLEENGDITFTQQIDDLSPACKNTAYFGLDANGNLSLFDGPPSDEKVIRTFFQLNMGYLESSLPHGTVDQLREGIPVGDMAEYNSILSTFSDFAVEETEKAMVPTN